MHVGLDIRDIGMAYDGLPLFERLTVSIPSGQRVVVTGQNGSGKTTFLKIVAGLTRPTQGSIALSLGDARIETTADRRLRVGYAGPDVNPYDELSARENLQFYARMRGVSEGVADGLLDRVGLKRSKQGDLVKTYSSGMRQRVRLAVSMLGSPAVLIWDEPGAMLDGPGREMVHELLAQHADGGGVVLVATNDPVEVEGWGDRRIHFGGQVPGGA